MDWKRELVIAHLIKQKIAEVDVDGLWKNTLPEVAASEEEIAAVEIALGYSIDSQYREFLLHANGWKAFEQNIDIFGVDDLVGGLRAHRATELIESMAPIKNLCGLNEADMQPIAVSSDDIDVVLIARPHLSESGKVFWFAGGLIDTFPSFEEYFLAMVDYNRINYQELVEKNKR